MNRRNLRKLANYLLNLPEGYEHFDMEHYLDSHNYTKDGYCSNAIKLLPKCGTVACAAGHGPSAGITPNPREGWDSYIQRVFRINEFGEWWSWAFDSSWQEFDNTPHGAALRILYMLDFGVPEKYTEPSRYYKRLYINAYDIVAA